MRLVVFSAENFGTEADGELLHADAYPARDDKMSELVHHDKNA